jgi:hypothetical protein
MTQAREEVPEPALPRMAMRMGCDLEGVSGAESWPESSLTAPSCASAS